MVSVIQETWVENKVCTATCRLFVTILIATMLAQPGTAQSSSPSHRPGNLIQHVVFIIKENRSFDNYFGKFPGANGATSGTTSSGQVIQLAATPDRVRDFCHTWTCTHAAIDNGDMDLFDLTPSANTFGDYLNYSQMSQQDIPNYFAYATNFTLADAMFSSLEGPSFSNHLYTIAAQSGGALDFPLNPSYGDLNAWGCDSPEGTTIDVLTNGVISKVFPCFDFPTIGDVMLQAGVSWGYYAPSAGEWGYAFSSFDAISAFRSSDTWTSNVLPMSQFVVDAQNGSLPAVSWVVPDSG